MVLLELITMVEDLATEKTFLNSFVSDMSLTDVLPQVKSPPKIPSASIHFANEDHFAN